MRPAITLDTAHNGDLRSSQRIWPTPTASTGGAVTLMRQLDAGYITGLVVPVLGGEAIGG
jgi:hypothetical protein